VIATVNHPSSRITAELAAEAEALGSAAIMTLPPFFGRWRAGPGEIMRHLQYLNDAVAVPIVLQDHALSEITLSVDFIAALAQQLEHLQYIKLESGNIIHKARALKAAAGTHLQGVFGGNSGVFLPEEIAAGCCGTMPACYMPDVFRRTWDLLADNRDGEAGRYFAPFARIAAYEKDIANRCVWKIVLVERGVIDSAAVREPVPGFADDFIRGQLLAIARSAGLLGNAGAVT
jgi:4-hydroxy-tetrahydrodipicolinate synthase